MRTMSSVATARNTSEQTKRTKYLLILHYNHNKLTYYFLTLVIAG